MCEKEACVCVCLCVCEISLCANAYPALMVNTTGGRVPVRICIFYELRAASDFMINAS